MLRLILARSVDGFLARGTEDDMRWTSPDDKRVFRLLTSDGATCGAGSTTFDRLPPLPGRHVLRLTTRPEDYQDDRQNLSVSLDRFAVVHPHGWLLGGPTVAMRALRDELVGVVYVCNNPAELGAGVTDAVTPFLASRGEVQNAGIPFQRRQSIKVGEVVIDVWSRLDVCRPHP